MHEWLCAAVVFRFEHSWFSFGWARPLSFWLGMAMCVFSFLCTDNVYDEKCQKPQKMWQNMSIHAINEHT